MMGLEVLGVGDGGLKGFSDEAGAFAGHNRQNSLGVGGGQALNLAHDFAHFLRGHADIFGDGLDFHSYLASALAVCAPCFLKVRVGENSPRRWPTMFSVTKTGLKT